MIMNIIIMMVFDMIIGMMTEMMVLLDMTTGYGDVGYCSVDVDVCVNNKGNSFDDESKYGDVSLSSVTYVGNGFVYVGHCYGYGDDDDDDSDSKDICVGGGMMTEMMLVMLL